MLGRIYDAIDKRLTIKKTIRDQLNHPVLEHVNPLKHPRAFVYCFGGITAFIIVLMFLTGLFMLVYYIPSPDHAYDSVQYIMNNVTMGWLVQGIHFWGATAVVVMIVLHMLRVYFHGAYKNPRELNWVVGILLLLIVLGFSFTGYLLPWTQRSYWATSVGTSMISLVPFVGDYLLKLVRGGAEIGAPTLLRFFAIHIGFLPLMLVLLLGAHFFIVRRQGISRPF
ncbi:MAG: cytochrome b N-terminal domain-containing protein [Chloroflexi bacterium]|nr:cytochrome b N-terminal domain-containing protein [Chloroflexota bacterium]